MQSQTRNGNRTAVWEAVERSDGLTAAERAGYGVLSEATGYVVILAKLGQKRGVLGLRERGDGLTTQVEIIAHADTQAYFDAVLAELDRLGFTQVVPKAKVLPEVEEEIAGQDPRPPWMDAMDDLILAEMRKTPQPTDKEIGKKGGLSASQVLHRRHILAAHGYTIAQKRQGQRPRTH